MAKTFEGFLKFLSMKSGPYNYMHPYDCAIAQYLGKEGHNDGFNRFHQSCVDILPKFNSCVMEKPWTFEMAHKRLKKLM